MRNHIRPELNAVAGRPAPFTSAACDLTDFSYMALDVARLRDSEMASSESPEACWAQVLLYAAAWHQVPAASIPNDDMWIAKTAGYAQRGKIDKAWTRVRPGALRGWIECTDGRLYHPVVAEKASEAWKGKLKHRWMTECGRIKKHNDRHGTSIEKPLFEQWLAARCPVGQPLLVPGDIDHCPVSVPEETHPKGEGEVEGDLDSEADASAAVAAASRPKTVTSIAERTKSDVWKAAVDVLQAGGCVSGASCRTFIGKLAQEHTFEIVRAAVSAAVAEQPADAREFLRAACMRLQGQRSTELGKQMTVPSEDADRTSAFLAERKRIADEIEANSTPEKRAARAARLLESRGRIAARA